MKYLLILSVIILSSVCYSQIGGKKMDSIMRMMKDSNLTTWSPKDSMTITATVFSLNDSLPNWSKIKRYTIPPISLAGVDQHISLKTKSVKLQGKGISDNGVIVSYLWTQVYGPTVMIDKPTKQTVIVKGFKDWGYYIFRLTVTDNLGYTDSDNVMVIVNF